MTALIVDDVTKVYGEGHIEVRSQPGQTVMCSYNFHR